LHIQVVGSMLASADGLPIFNSKVGSKDGPAHTPGISES